MNDDRLRTVARTIAAAKGLSYGECDDFTRAAFRVQAQNAIEADTAWLKERGFGVAPKIMTDEMAMHAVAAQPLSGPFNLKEMMIRGWNTAFSFAPYPDKAIE